MIRSVSHITLEGAKAAVAAAEAEAVTHGWNVTIAVVDPAGHLVALHRMDGAILASVEVASGKARAAAMFGKPTKALEDGVNGGDGRTALLSTSHTLMEGGIPIEVAGGIVGAIGVSGVAKQQDAQVAMAGAAAVQAT